MYVISCGNSSSTECQREHDIMETMLILKKVKKATSNKEYEAQTVTFFVNTNTQLRIRE